MPGGSTGPGGLAVGELADERVDSRSLPGRDLGGERDPAGLVPGNPQVTGFRPVPHPDRIGQHILAGLAGRPPRRPAGGLVVGVSVCFPGREADLESGALLAQDGRQLVFASASPVSGSRSLITSISRAPSTAKGGG